MEDNFKKALWIPIDLHTEIKIFAAKNITIAPINISNFIINILLYLLIIIFINRR